MQATQAPLGLELEVHGALGCAVSFAELSAAQQANPAPCDAAASEAGGCLKGPQCRHHHDPVGGKKQLVV